MNALRLLLDRLGPAGVISLGVLLFCAYFHVTSVQPLERELAAQRTAAERLRTRSPVELAGAPDKADQVRRFHELFPPVSRLPAELERVYAFARTAGLTIQKGDYRLESRGADLLSYRLAFPVIGSYSQIRQFVGTVLKDMPIASIDALRFERRRVGDAQLEGQVRLTVYFRPDGDVGPSTFAPPVPSTSALPPPETALPAAPSAPSRSAPPAASFPPPPPRNEPEL